MKYPSYPKYKNTGIKWQREIPEEWEELRLKYSADLINEKVDSSTSELPFTGLENIESWTGKRINEVEDSISEGQANLYESGDVLFCKLRPYLAKVLHVNENGICTGELLVLRSKEVIGAFLSYYLLTRDCIMVIDSSTYGAKMPRANWDFIGNLPTLIPSKDEQTTIASFLDLETEKIDTLISKKERQIELLQEKRSSLISHAVTKGIDPDVKMKDSGVEWLGEIPDGWEAKRLKYIASINDEALGENTKPDYELLYVDISSIDSAKGIINIEPMLFEKAPSRARRIVREGDVIVSTVRTYLRAIAPITNAAPNLIVSTGFAVVRPKLGFNSAYAAYALRATYFVDSVVSRSVGVSYPAINASEIGTLAVAHPPHSEQKAIAFFLDRETEKIDFLIEKIKLSIEKLREYRTALISAAVTGKIDVRGIS